MKIIGVSLLLCFVLAFATAASAQSDANIKLDVFSGSNNWWLAIAVRNAGVDTRSVQIKQAGSSSWQSMDFQRGWGYFTISTNSKLNFPVSVQITSVGGEQVAIENIITSTSVGVVETGVKYSGTSAATASPTSSATTRPSATARPSSTRRPSSTPRPPATARPVTTKATKKPTGASTTRPTSAAATSKPSSTRVPTSAATRPSSVPATTRPSSVPATNRPTSVATTRPTSVATNAATTRPTSGSSTGCSAPIKVLVPLYMYPGSQWDTVIAGASKVKTVAVINPSSGPGTSGPSNTFKTYMTEFDQAGVEMIGYVHTSYGARSITTVKKEIDEYATKFPSVVGIFLDEVSAKDSELAYYKELYRYIMSMPGWKYDVINPGATPTSGYLDAATQIVSFETDASKFSSSSNPSFASCSNKDKFSVITYGASSSAMRSVVDTARSKGWYGWVYATDGTLNGGTYNKLPSYYSDMAQYIADTN